MQVGQSVEVKIETFNFTRYGLLHGRVTDYPMNYTRYLVERETRLDPDEARPWLWAWVMWGAM